MSKYKKIFALMLMIFTFGFLFHSVQAANLDDIGKNLGDVGSKMGAKDKQAPLPDIIANVIKFVMAISGTALLVLVVFAGFSWMTSGGDPGKIEKAKKLLSSGVIGLVIIFAAYTLTDFVVANITNLTKPSP